MSGREIAALLSLMEATRPTEPLNGVHVLVVDDDTDACELLATALGYFGALVTVAASAHEALAILGCVVPDIVLSDISMPEADGYWLIGQIRALPRNRGGSVPAVAVTALGGNRGSSRALAAGFQAHVRKPVDPDELSRLIASLTGRSADVRR